VNPRNAILFSVLFAVLLPYYFYVDRPQLKPPSQVQLQHESLLKLSSIDSITITRGSESLTYQKTADGKRYQLMRPPNAFMPQDLMQAVVSLLLGAHQVEVVADNTGNLAEFGLDHPKTEMSIIAPGRTQPLKIYFGNENPVHTAVYARIEGIPKVFLLGSQLEYYQVLMFQWVEGKQGKNA
jgi:Domain of unknown function (DUF4340)